MSAFWRCERSGRASERERERGGDRKRRRMWRRRGPVAAARKPSKPTGIEKNGALASESHLGGEPLFPHQWVLPVDTVPVA